MAILTSMVDSIDNLLDYLGSKSKQSISDYCDIETVDQDSVLVSKNGSLLSIISVDGVKKLMSSGNFYDDVVMRLHDGIQTSFGKKGHMLQFWFQVDHDNTKKELQSILAPAKNTAKVLGMDMDDLFEERENNLLDWTAAENCYIVLWTLPDILSKSDLKRGNENAKKDKGKFNASTQNSQNPLRGIVELRDTHNSFVTLFREFLSVSDITSNILNVKEAVRDMRKSVDSEFTGENWEPSLPGDFIFPSVRKNAPAKEEFDILWPKLGWQICPRDAQIIDSNVVRIGDRIYSPMYMDLFQKNPEPFANLFSSLRSKRIPWRVSFLIEGDGLSSFGFKGMAAQLLGFASSQNKMISRGIDYLKGLKEIGDGEIVSTRAAFATWAPKDQPQLLSKRASELARSVEGWGSCQVSEITGDPIAGVMSSALGVTQGNIGTKTAMPLEHALFMQPLSRPSSPWPSGAVTFRSPDGKIMPYQPYSSLQTTWINLIFAKPGSGKSVLMNMCNLALCMAPGLERLPRIAIIDIGPSSSGLISLLKEALPPEKKRQVLYKRLQMIEEDSINPFDTQLGCRFPTPTELSFLRNFLTLLVTDVNSELPDKAISGLVSAVIDYMYLARSDKYEPAAYARGIEPRVDESIAKIGYAVDRKTTWWEIVDVLFDFSNKENDEFMMAASLAQRQAVPLLADAVAAARQEKIANTFKEVKIEGTGETLIAGFCRMVEDALSLYPLLARETRFDIGDARVVSLDLDQVAKSGGAISDRTTAVMYMLARQVLAKDYYLGEEVVELMPAPSSVSLRDTVPVEAYREYHRKRIGEIRSDPKRICYDEFHRTTKARQVREQVLLDMREGRKWKVDVMLSSQLLTDFDDDMISFATGIFVMDGGNAIAANEIAAKFGFENESERVALQKSVHGPKRGGGTFLAKFSTNSGWYTMLLSATLGPIELWAFSTTAEDVIIRNKLYSLVGPKRARKLLALRFPGGSAKNEIESRKEKLKDKGIMLFDESPEDLLEEMVNEIIEYGESKGM
ncbi:TPA: hypothetical protein NV714_003291 [Escherichia coli]|nr:hypothetical protein [Escherichia coli]